MVHSWGDPKLLDPRLHSCHFDTDNNVWIASAPSGMVQKYSHDGAPPQIGKKGVSTFRRHRQGQPLNSNAAQFFMPSSIFVDRKTATSMCLTAKARARRRIAAMDQTCKFLRQWQPVGCIALHDGRQRRIDLSATAAKAASSCTTSSAT